MGWNPFCNTPTQNRGLELCRVFYMKPNSALERPLFQVSPQNLLARKCEELGVENEENAGAMRGLACHPFLEHGCKGFDGRYVCGINHLVFAIRMCDCVIIPFHKGIVVVERFKEDVVGRRKDKIHY